MTNDRNDGDLRADFDALSDEVGRSAPDFASMFSAARDAAEQLPQLQVVDGGNGTPPSGLAEGRHAGRGRSIATIGGWVSLAAAAAAAGLLMLNPPMDQADADFEALVASYSTVARTPSPTAALLNMPGLDLASVPRIGATAIPDLESGVDS